MSQPRKAVSKVASFSRSWGDDDDAAPPSPSPASDPPPAPPKNKLKNKDIIDLVDSDDEEGTNAMSWPPSPKATSSSSSSSKPFQRTSTSQKLSILEVAAQAAASYVPPPPPPSSSSRSTRIATPDLSPRSRRRRAVLGDDEQSGSSSGAVNGASGSGSGSGGGGGTSALAAKRSLSDPWESQLPAKKRSIDVGPSTVVVETKKSKKKSGKIDLSEEQTKVRDMVVKEGKNVFFTGSAGTGKSVLLREIIKGLREKYRTRPDAVAVTASTGIAACNVGGTTLHSFAGIGLGIEPADQLAAKVKKNQKAMSRWTRTKVLIIDEVSMVDGDLFDKLAKIATILRRDQAPFGGIQLIVTGDFFQLPPVAKGEPKFAFEARMWKESIHRTVNLTQVFRQKDQTFVDMLNEMRFGSLSPASIQRFNSLSRTVFYEDGIEPTELYPRREDVDNSNAARLKMLKTESKLYQSSDDGSLTDPVQLQKELSNMLAVKDLQLKVDCQVMLVKNLDDDLVNGSIGRVRGFYSSDDWPLIAKDFDQEVAGGGGGMIIVGEELTREEKKQKRMQDGGARAVEFPAVTFSLPGGGVMTRLITSEEFKVEEQNGNVKASRTQIPLILSWAMSIHKSQGQTLERVKVDLRRIFEKGQAYVALSRATNLEALQVMNFDAKKVMCHAKVAKFSHSLEIIT